MPTPPVSLQGPGSGGPPPGPGLGSGSLDSSFTVNNCPTTQTSGLYLQEGTRLVHPGAGVPPPGPPGTEPRGRVPPPLAAGFRSTMTTAKAASWPVCSTHWLPSPPPSAPPAQPGPPSSPPCPASCLLPWGGRGHWDGPGLFGCGGPCGRGSSSSGPERRSGRRRPGPWTDRWGTGTRASALSPDPGSAGTVGFRR